MRVKEVSEEAIFAVDPLVTVGRDYLEGLKQKAKGNRRERIRLCTHQDVESTLHEMFIVHVKDTYIRPHKQLVETKSFHVIEGSADVVVFDEEGNIVEVTTLGEHTSGKPFYYRISNTYYHMLIIRSDVLVFLETTNGPFSPSDNLFAPWSPDNDDPVGIEKFMAKLAGNIEGLLLDKDRPL